MNMERIMPKNGFVALMSVIIISAFLLVMIFTLGLGTFLSRINVLDIEFKKTSRSLAEACANQTMLKLAQNSSYTPVSSGECIGVGDTCGASGAKLTCRICQVSAVGSDRTILTRAVYSGAYTNIQASITLEATNVTVKDWKELGSYGGPVCPLP